MSDTKFYKKLSKFLSVVLRHKPEILGIELDRQGWTDLDTLIEKMNSDNEDNPHRRPVDRSIIEEVVAVNNKQRFSLSTDGQQIRANQGHSVAVDLGYQPMQPPEVLFHGTAIGNLPSITEGGLHKGNRHHVHLSKDRETALQVGQRHGKPVVLEVMAGEMHRNGLAFYLSENGVWLTEEVPVIYLQLEN